MLHNNGKIVTNTNDVLSRRNGHFYLFYGGWSVPTTFLIYYGKFLHVCIFYKSFTNRRFFYNQKEERGQEVFRCWNIPCFTKRFIFLLIFSDIISFTPLFSIWKFQEIPKSPFFFFVRYRHYRCFPKDLHSTQIQNFHFLLTFSIFTVHPLLLGSSTHFCSSRQISLLLNCHNDLLSQTPFPSNLNITEFTVLFLKPILRCI